MSNVSRITGHYKIESNTTKIDLNNQGGAFKTIFSKSGSTGNLYSFLASFNNENVVIKLTIDEKEAFIIDGDDINDYFGDSNGEDGNRFGSMFQLNRQKDTIHFKPCFPLLFRDSITIEARANSNSNSRDFQAIFVELSEE